MSTMPATPAGDARDSIRFLTGTESAQRGMPTPGAGSTPRKNIRAFLKNTQTQPSAAVSPPPPPPISASRMAVYH